MAYDQQLPVDPEAFGLFLNHPVHQVGLFPTFCTAATSCGCHAAVHKCTWVFTHTCILDWQAYVAYDQQLPVDLEAFGECLNHPVHQMRAKRKCMLKLFVLDWQACMAISQHLHVDVEAFAQFLIYPVH